MDEMLMEMHRKSRVGLGRHAKLVNEWCRVSGVRESIRGLLTAVEEVGGGVAILHFSSAKALDALCDRENEVEIGETEVYSHMILQIQKQPADWPKT